MESSPLPVVIWAELPLMAPETSMTYPAEPVLLMATLPFGFKGFADTWLPACSVTPAPADRVTELPVLLTGMPPETVISPAAARATSPDDRTASLTVKAPDVVRVTAAPVRPTTGPP